MAKIKCSELAKILLRMSQNLASRDGINNLDDTHAEIRKQFPNITREFLVDSIVEATTGARQNTDRLISKLNSIKREARADKALRDKVAKLQKHLEEGTLPEPRARAAGEAPEAVQQLRDIVDDLQSQLRHSKPAVKKRLEASIKELQRRIDDGDFGPREKRAEAPMDKELARLVYERDRLRNEIRGKISAMKPRSIWSKVFAPFNFARSIMTSVDVSAVARQGGFIVAGHPIRGAKSIPAMMKAFASDQKAVEINAEILDRENAPLYARSKLYLAPLDGAPNASEEAFMSRLARKIPGVAGSGRAYVTFLNKLRADSFDAMTDSLAAGGEVTDAESQAIANYINVATGRGPLGGFDQAGEALASVFFAPRYVTSRFALLAGQPFYGGNARTRKLIAKEYARYLMGISVVYFLAYLGGGEPDDDPTSSDFGKIKFGNTRIDPLSGLS